MSDLKQGGLANSSGNTLESTIRATLVSKGFEIVPYRDYSKNPTRYGKELLLLSVPYETIYGHKGKTEFLLRSEHYALDVRIECKWQQSLGSVDEKFPYLYLNCIEKMPEEKIFIVMDGGGAKTGSIDWLKKASSEKLYTTALNKNKEIIVMTLSEFLVWSNKTLR